MHFADFFRKPDDVQAILKITEFSTRLCPGKASRSHNGRWLVTTAVKKKACEVHAQIHLGRSKNVSRRSYREGGSTPWGIHPQYFVSAQVDIISNRTLMTISIICFVPEIFKKERIYNRHVHMTSLQRLGELV